ncbi:MAG: arginine--tRNA ligase [Gemmatimonadota bacterium]
MTDESVEPREALVAELQRAARAAGAPDDFEPQLDRPADLQHGDYSSNAALVLAGPMGTSPRDLAVRIAESIDRDGAAIRQVDVAGPGFLNFTLSDEVLWTGLASLLREDTAFGRSKSPRPSSINVEFVSTNPTGPLHVAHGRGAAIGDAVASLLEWTGHSVTREFYVNDVGRQIDLLAESVEARGRELRGEPFEIPDGGYQGDYVADLARMFAEEEDHEGLWEAAPEVRLKALGARSVAALRAGQELDLAEFRVNMDVFVEEGSLFDSGAVQSLLEQLESAGATYREDGALWLRTSQHGDEKDRVLIKSDGSHTYFLTDIAYHLDKAARGFDLSIDVWGADHHGHIGRMHSALVTAGLGPDFLEVLIIQLVTVLRDGAEVRMSKRAGEFVTLRDLVRETGPDVARYFFLMRRAEVPLSFDLDLALDTSDANPLYKVQYAHARMCSVFARGEIDLHQFEPTRDDLALLTTEAEREVAKWVLRFPEIVQAAAVARAPYQVCHYLEDVAAGVNSWYHQGNLDPTLRILAEGPQRAGRLALAKAIRITLRQGLTLLGLSAPDQMARSGD